MERAAVRHRRGASTTSLIPHGDRGFEIAFDFVDHQLDIVGRPTAGAAVDGTRTPIGRRLLRASSWRILDDLGLHTEIWTMPVEIADAIPFERPTTSTRPTTPTACRRSGWRSSQMDRVFSEFRARFVGKCSPVHLFWGALDLAVTRFSGRGAPLHPGGAPNCGPFVMHEAYSHEVSSAGYWPGGDGEGVFYSYAYPEPDGLPRRPPSRPSAAHFDEALGEFVLPYEAVRTARRPRRDAARVPAESTYEAAADLADWDRDALERPY